MECWHRFLGFWKELIMAIGVHEIRVAQGREEHFTKDD
jgi:hypothetical protein